MINMIMNLMIIYCCCDMINLSPSLSIFIENLFPIQNLRSVAATRPTIFQFTLVDISFATPTKPEQPHRVISV